MRANYQLIDPWEILNMQFLNSYWELISCMLPTKLLMDLIDESQHGLGDGLVPSLPYIISMG